MSCACAGLCLSLAFWLDGGGPIKCTLENSEKLLSAVRFHTPHNAGLKVYVIFNWVLMIGV